MLLPLFVGAHAPPPPLLAVLDQGLDGRDGVFVDRVFGGGFHCVILDSTAMAWSWGWNVRGQLGRRVQIQAQPYRLVSLKYVRVKSAALGHIHTLLLTDAQQVFVFGDNTYGQLGTGERGPTTSLFMPMRLPIGGSSVLQVAAGCVHSLALTQGGVYSWGYGAVGQLGHDDFLTHAAPKQVIIPLPVHAQRTRPMHTPNATHAAHKQIDLFERLNLPVARLAAGCYHSLAVLEGGELYAWGHDAHGLKVAVLAAPYLATIGSSSCVRRLGAALRTRQERPSTSDAAGRPWP